MTETTIKELKKMLDQLPEDAIIKVYSDRNNTQHDLALIEYSEVTNRAFLLANFHDDDDDELIEEYKVKKFYVEGVK